MPLRILVVDDSATMQKVVRIALSRFAVKVVASASISDAVSEVSKNTPDLVVIDAFISGTQSHDDLQMLAKAAKQCPFLLLVGTHQNINESDYRAHGFKFFLRKPFESADMIAAMAKALGKDLPATAGAGTKMPAADDAASAALPQMPAFKTTVMIPPPPNKRAAGEDAHLPPPPPRIDEGRRGQKAFPDIDTAADLLAEPGRTDDILDKAQKAKNLPPPPPAKSRPSLSPPPASPKDAIDNISRDELATTVRKAVEEYCQKHFASLAREIITAELRRLAEERSRHFIE